MFFGLCTLLPLIGTPLINPKKNKKMSLILSFFTESTCFINASFINWMLPIYKRDDQGVKHSGYFTAIDVECNIRYGNKEGVQDKKKSR